MTEREKMLAGQLYDCGDAQLLAQWHKAKDLMRDYNRADSTNLEEKERILNALLGGRGKNLWITAPFYVDYGNNIYFGDHCEVNMDSGISTQLSQQKTHKHGARGSHLYMCEKRCYTVPSFVFWNLNVRVTSQCTITQSITYSQR